MALFNNLNGTTKFSFYLGGAKSLFLSVVSGRFRFRNNADDAFVNVQVGRILDSGSDDNDAATLMDMRGRVADIQAAFAGSSPSTVVNGTFAFCHTSGGTFTAGRIYYGKGGVWIVMPTIVCQHMTTRTAVIGTVSLDANAIYSYEGSTWVKKGRGMDNGWRCIAVPFAFGSSYPLLSTTLVPANAVVTKSIVNITTGFTAGFGLALTINSTTPITLLDSAVGDLDTDIANQYDNEQVYIPATSGAVRIAKTGSPSVGAGVVYVLFGESES